jgi:hypothetical protein
MAKKAKNPESKKTKKAKKSNEKDRAKAADLVRTSFSTVADAFPSSEHALSELAIHGAISVLMDRAKKFNVPAMCVRCTADPSDPDCMLFVPDASGQLRPSHKIPKSEAGKYTPCG